MGQLELIGKSYEDVEEQLSEIPECADLPKETIVQLLAGVDSDDVSSDNNQESDNGEVEAPIEIDSTEEVIKLDDSDENHKSDRDRSRDRSRSPPSRRRRDREPSEKRVDKDIASDIIKGHIRRVELKTKAASSDEETSKKSRKRKKEKKE